MDLWASRLLDGDVAAYELDRLIDSRLWPLVATRCARFAVVSDLVATVPAGCDLALPVLRVPPRRRARPALALAAAGLLLVAGVGAVRLPSGSRPDMPASMSSPSTMSELGSAGSADAAVVAERAGDVLPAAEVERGSQLTAATAAAQVSSAAGCVRSAGGWRAVVFAALCALRR